MCIPMSYIFTQGSTAYIAFKSSVNGTRKFLDDNDFLFAVQLSSIHDEYNITSGFY